VAHGDKRRRQLVETLRHPQQRADRVAQRHRLDEALEIIEQRCVRFRQWSRAAAFTANLPRGKWRRIEVFQSALNGTARQPGDVRDGSQTTPSAGARLARCKQPPTALVPLRTVRFPPLPNRVPIDHANADTVPHSAEESPSTESHGRRALHGLSRFTYRCGCPKARSVISAPLISANPAIGELQWPLSTHSTSRSASAQACAVASSMRDSSMRVCQSAAAHSTATIPWPTAGNISAAENS